MNEPELKLAKVTSATLGIEDHGFLTSFLFLDYADVGRKIGGSGQGFGGRALGGAYTDRWVRGVLDALGVDDWSKIGGQYVWVSSQWDKVHYIIGVETGIKFDPSEWDKERDEDKEEDK